MILIVLHEKKRDSKQVDKKTLFIPIEPPEHLHKNDLVTVKTCGNIIETVFLSYRNKTCKIKKIDKNHYIDLETGEVKEFQHNENRQHDLNSVRTSLGRLRDYLNTNVTQPQNCRWITLTYAENMTDTIKLYKDFEKFIKRFKYAYGDIEYIVAMEPQARGAWHAHLVIIFPKVAPFIANNKLAEIWGHGFVKIKRLDNVDNIGAYLTAYLADMEYSKEYAQDIKKNTRHDIKIKDITTNKNTSKKYIKGGRLYMYPNSFNIYRISKGIKKPIKELLKEHELQERIDNLEMTFEKAVSMTTIIFDDSNIDCKELIIYYRHYNRLKPKRETQKESLEKISKPIDLLNWQDTA